MPFPDPMIKVLTVFRPLFTAPNMEETNDVVNRNAVFAGTPDGRNSPECQRQRAGGQLELLRIRCSTEHDGLPCNAKKQKDLRKIL
jgi:hypothetical protein